MNRSQELNDVLSQGLLKYLQEVTQNGWHSWGPWALAALGLVAVLAFALFLRTRLRYKITPSHLEVALYGVPIRRLPLENIRHVHLRRRRFAERWDNNLFPRRNGLLVLEKRRGLFKSLVITPAKRQVFKVKLEQAMAQSRGTRQATVPVTASPESDLAEDATGDAAVG